MKLYHYRSINSALLEIENGTFHFASKEELNDPLEGFVRVFWQGDKMAWEGLFRHYIYSVARALKLYILKADDETLYLSLIHILALFMSISEGVPEIKLAQVKMKMEFQSESDGAPL